MFNQKAYHAFVKRLWDSGMLDAMLKPLERVGVFFVWKSNETRLRLIMDARRSNCRFRPPPGVRLCTSEVFAGIEVGDGDPGGLRWAKSPALLRLAGARAGARADAAGGPPVEAR